MIRLDITDFEKVASGLGATADQMPFLLSVALNRAAVKTREYLVGQTWPSSVTVRNPSFIKRALRIDFSKKHDLVVEIYDDLDRAHLKKHAEGGIKTPKNRNLAVPNQANVKLGSHGVPKGKRPRSLPKNTTFVQNNRIYTTVGKGKNRRLKLMYYLKPRVNIPKDVPFYDDFQKQMILNMFDQLPAAVVKAMSTRK